MYSFVFVVDLRTSPSSFYFPFSFSSCVKGGAQRPGLLAHALSRRRRPQRQSVLREYPHRRQAVDQTSVCALERKVKDDTYIRVW